jgi:histidinol dehydrogenase
MAVERTYLKRAERTTLEIPQDVTDAVRDILSDVHERGDGAVRGFTRKFDGVEREVLRVEEEIAEAREELTDEERETIKYTIGNVREFHEE